MSANDKYIEIVLRSNGYIITRELIKVKDIIDPDDDSLVSTRERAVEMHGEATIAEWTPYAAPAVSASMSFGRFILW